MSSSRVVVVSTGQIGVERLALQCARSCGLPTKGSAPMTTKRLFMEKYGLKSPDKLRLWEVVRHKRRLISAYHGCLMQNVDDSSVTVMFRVRSAVGLDGILNYCRGGYFSEMGTERRQPCLVVSQISDPDSAAREFRTFLERHKATTIHICGHRSDTTANYQGYLDKVSRILLRVFEKLSQDAK